MEISNYLPVALDIRLTNFLSQTKNLNLYVFGSKVIASSMIRSLILAGGQSSRMGSPKSLLDVQTGDGKTIPLIAKTLEVHGHCQDNHTGIVDDCTAISVRDMCQQQQLQAALATSSMSSRKVYYLADRLPHAGPSSGLVRAYEHDPTAHWLVTGCDYPLLEPNALDVLIDENLRETNSITCFRNAEGWNEPLLAIWSPTALQRLQELTREEPAIGPSRVIRENMTRKHGPHVNLLTPLRGSWILSVDTKEEWTRVQPELIKQMTQSDK
jgi:molybdopterin-guanine dinucleotide biosynthesis protein A